MANISLAQMARLFRRLATGYAAGIDLKTLYAREAESGTTAYRLKSREVLQQISAGNSLADAMRSAGTFFPELAVATVRAGEHGGRLEESFDRLASHYESLVKFRNSFLISIAWPLFELMFALFVIGVLILVLGMLAGDEAANWFGMGTAWANFLFYVACIATLAFTITMLVVGIRHGWFGTWPMRFARKLPLLGRTIEALALSRLAWTMSIAENAGMAAVDTARLSLHATQNYFYTQLEGPVCDSIERGGSFAESFKRTDAFPVDFLIYMENGELSGQLAESMDRASRDLQTTAENNLKILGTVGFVCTFLLVAVVIGTVVITMVQKFYLNPINELLNG